MATPPPLIRSSKPFSVEIPEGSNSAKSRRSDVVGSDELQIKGKKSDFKTSDAALLPEMHHAPGNDTANRSAHHEDALTPEKLNVKEGAALDAPHLVHDDPHAAENVQSVSDDALKDHQVGLPATEQAGSTQEPVVAVQAFADQTAGGADNAPLKDRFATEAVSVPAKHAAGVETEALKDNIQSVADDALDDNLQAVPSAGALKDNLQALPGAEAIKDNLQAVPQDGSQKRDAGIDKEQVSDNIAAVPQDALASQSQGVPKESLKDRKVGEAVDPIHDRTAGEAVSPLKDRQADVGNDAIEDNLQGLPDDASEDNRQEIDHPGVRSNTQALQNESLEDNPQRLDNQALKDNTQGLPNEALEDRSADTDKEHVQDHVVALPDQATQLKDGPKPTAPNKPTRSGSDTAQTAQPKGKASVKATTPAKAASAAQTEQLQAAKLEQTRKMDEFHGRVEALKKTVSGINHLLDELEEKKPDNKH